MVRTQIQLTEEQAAAVKQLAQREGRSVADVVRESLEVHLRTRGVVDRGAQKRRALDAVGRFRSGASDLGTAHDRHAAEAFAE
jgi:predicted DNA-binding protein